MTFKFAFFSAFLLAAITSVLLAYSLPFYWKNCIGLFLFSGLMLALNQLVQRIKDGKALTQFLMGSIVVRLLIALIGVAIASLASYPEFVIFTAHFGAHFLLFTLFETLYLVKYLNS